MELSVSRKKMVRLSIPSELGYEKLAILAVATVAEKGGFSPAQIDCLKTAVAEAVTNAIEHGNLRQTELKVLIDLTLQKTVLVLEVVDQGCQPIPQIPAERAEREDYRGWGLYLIKNLVDEVEVTASPRSNGIRMVAYRKS